MRIPPASPIIEVGPPDVPGIVVTANDAVPAATRVAPYRIEFRPRNERPDAVQVLVSCEEADICRAQVESCARRLLDDRRSGEVHLVESASRSSLAQRPVWPAGEAPQPEWVAWSRHTLLPRL